MYDPLHAKIAKLIKSNTERIHILDIGCGEGSHLKKLINNMDAKATGIGIDIAKDGILTAAKYHSEVIWAVADLAKSPLQTNKFDVILNILSPANYQEFNRLLSEDGMVIKVIPNTDYLKEIREQVTDKNSAYSNTDTIEHFSKHFSKLKTYRLLYQWEVPAHLQESLWEMTPLTWDRKRENEYKMITIDLTILVGQR